MISGHRGLALDALVANLLLLLALLVPVAFYFEYGGVRTVDANTWLVVGELSVAGGPLSVYRAELERPDLFYAGYYVYPLP